ncbi:hypothetical protein GCM10009663_27070 [Kitasatospora arboriphila]|uniref:Alkylmercury lyase n=2 Tax=Kitasatospora arboriphila TaxID=258052 RepID=A0ABN1TGD5_9ACTN
MTPAGAATLAERARRAAAMVRAAVEAEPDPRLHASERVRARLRIASLLGIPPTAVTVADDDRRATLAHAAVILAAADPADPAASYRFSIADPFYDDDTVRLLGACPVCGAEVPVRDIANLADLADADRPLEIPDCGSGSEGVSYSFADDRGHSGACTYGPGA